MAGKGIHKRGKDSYTVIVDLGRDPATGKRRQLWRSVKGTKQDAERERTRLLRERDTGIDIDPARLTVADYLQRWLRDYAARKVAPSTLTRYREMVTHHLTPRLGSLRLTDLRPAHIQAAYAKFTGREGQPLSPRTVGHVHALLRESLRWAVHWQLIARNPSDAVAPPRPQRQEMRVLDQEDAQGLLDAARDTPHYTLLYLALATGARLGELLALRWQDVDLDAGMMQIVRTQRFFSRQGIVSGQPKTPRSRRPIALSAETVRILAEHRRRQLEQRLTVGPAYQNEGRVFADATGGALYDSTVRRAFYGIVERAGLAHLRLHDLRHTAATLMLRSGVNAKVVSERLGHAKVGFTLDTYSHVLPDMQREAAAVMDRVLGSREVLANG